MQTHSKTVLFVVEMLLDQRLNSKQLPTIITIYFHISGIFAHCAHLVNKSDGISKLWIN